MAKIKHTASSFQTFAALRLGVMNDSGQKHQISRKAAKTQRSERL